VPAEGGEVASRQSACSDSVTARATVPSADPVGDANQLAREATASVAAAGAAGALVYLDAPGAVPLLNLPSDPILQLALSREEGERLRAMLGDKELRVSLDGRLTPERVYHLRHEHPGGVGAGYLPRVDPERLAVVKASYHSDKPALVDFESWHGLSPLHPSSFDLSRGFWVPAKVTELIGEPTTAGFSWNHWVFQSTGPLAGSGTFLSKQGTYPPGQPPRQESWFASPVHMGMPEQPTGVPRVFCSLCRDNDWFVPAQYEVDSTPAADHQFFFFDSGSSTPRLVRDGNEIQADRSRGYPRFPLAPEPATYRLDLVERQRAADVRVLAPRVTSSWTFRSERPSAGQLPAQYLCRTPASACAFQPLILLRYQLGLDLLNQAPAGAPFEFQVHAGAHSGVPNPTPVLGMAVSTSTDGGRTWRPATVRPDGDGRFSVEVDHPPLGRTDGFVSLRVEAWDAAGGRVTQTVERAYGLTGG
jgi:hypothetical protein